jgi:hypothetical protein
MIVTDLQEVANTVVRRAQRQGYVLPTDIREELAHTGLPETQWKDVVNMSGTLLRHRQGRYYYQAQVGSRLQEERRQKRAIQQTVRHLLRYHKKTTTDSERRRQGRRDFIQPVQVYTDDKRAWTLLSRDLSETGIRLIGTRSLLGQKVYVEVPRSTEEGPARFLVRILWTCTVGDGLFENGGTFLELATPETEPVPAKLLSL